METIMDTTDRDLLIRIDENVKELSEDIKAIDKILHGNGRPGMMDRMQAIEIGHNTCKEERTKQKTWPAVVAAICAIVAVAINLMKL